MCVNVEHELTAVAVACEATAKTSLGVLALSLFDRACFMSMYGSRTGCCSSTCCGGAAGAARVTASRGGGHRQEAIPPFRWWRRIVCVEWVLVLCVSRPKAAIPRDSEGKNNVEPTIIAKPHIRACTCTFKYRTTHGPAL